MNRREATLILELSFVSPAYLSGYHIKKTIGGNIEVIGCFQNDDC